MLEHCYLLLLHLEPMRSSPPAQEKIDVGALPGLLLSSINPKVLEKLRALAQNQSRGSMELNVSADKDFNPPSALQQVWPAFCSDPSNRWFWLQCQAACQPPWNVTKWTFQRCILLALVHIVLMVCRPDSSSISATAYRAEGTPMCLPPLCKPSCWLAPSSPVMVLMESPRNSPYSISFCMVQDSQPNRSMIVLHYCLVELTKETWIGTLTLEVCTICNDPCLCLY